MKSLPEIYKEHKYNQLLTVDVFQEAVSWKENAKSIGRWDKVFKNGPSKICGRQPLKNLK